MGLLDREDEGAAFLQNMGIYNICWPLQQRILFFAP